MILHLVFIGDIVGKPGRDLVRLAAPRLAARYEPACLIANAENAAGGFGVTRETGEAILASGIELMTSGNHIWDKREALEYIAREDRLLRPINFPPGVPGRGSAILRTTTGDEVAVINAMGRVHMTPLDNPFTIVRAEVERLRARTPLVLVDFHAEATSEKIAMGWHLDGLATAVIGTHTHVQTADDRVLPGGTAYITDVGMTGPHDSIIGVDRTAALARFLTGLPSRFDTATGDPRLHAVVVAASTETGRAVSIERLNLTPAALESDEWRIR